MVVNAGRPMPTPRRVARLACAATLSAAFVHAVDARAHGFGQRYDLPVPLDLFLFGAAAVVALSFVVMALFMRRKTAMIAGLPRTSGASVPVAPIVVGVCRVASVSLLALTVAAGFFGNPSPVKNIAPIMVWAIWWVGMAFVCALVGNVWALINPLETLFAWAESACRRMRPGARLARELRYPPAAAAWPAVIFFFAFAWAELLWDDSDRPVYVASAVLAYCTITWTGMFLFGRRQWLEHGEAFALIFSLLGRFAPIDVRSAGDRQELTLRPYAVGLLVEKPVHASLLVLVVMMLATVTFDGLMETPLWAALAERLRLWLGGSGDGSAVGTLGLAATVGAFLAIYSVSARLIAAFATSAARQGDTPAAGDVARYFVFTLVPIAIGYHLAHYLSFLVMAAQYLIPLASDPFGMGWDLFGTRNYRIRIDIVDARFVWYASLTAIVAGHIAAVCLAHTMALRVFGDPRAALRSQYPMLALMVGYTMMSLWIIAQPIVSSRFG